MIRTPKYQPMNFSERRKRQASQSILQKQQYKHAYFLTRFGIMFGVFLTGFSLYLLNSNYSLFEKTLLVYAPSVIASLTDELHIANVFLLGSFLAYCFFMALLGARISHQIVVPVFLIQEKMKMLCRGDFKNAKLSIRKSDDFQEYCETYNHMADILKTQIEIDIGRLKNIKPDPKNHDATHIWEQMLAEKQALLGIGPASAEASNAALELDPIPSSRRAS